MQQGGAGQALGQEYQEIPQKEELVIYTSVKLKWKLCDVSLEGET